MLVLPGEVVLSDGTTKMFESSQRLALGVKRFANMATNCASISKKSRLDDVSFLFLGDSGQAYMLPVLLLQYVANEIVLVQALHNNIRMQPVRLSFSRL